MNIKLKSKRNKGITLIALVITIIILLILAAITISTLTGENGLFKRAIQAKEQTEIAAAKEKLLMRITDLSIEILDKENRSIVLKDIIKIDSDEFVVKKNEDSSLYVTQYNEKDCTIVNCDGYEFYVFADGTVIYTGEQRDKDEVKDEEEKKVSYSKTGLKVYLDGQNNTGNGQNKNATTWKNLSSNGNDATIHGATWMDDGLYFDGEDDWANLGYQDYGNYTLEVVFEANKLGLQSVFANWQTGGYGIDINENSQIRDITYINGGYNRISNDETLNIETKYKVTATCNGKEHKLYINGELINSSTVQDGLIEIPDFNTVMAIGGNPLKDNIEGLYFNGKVYLVRIYNRVLSEEEVKQNYNYDNKQININDVYFENLDITDNIYKINSLGDLKQFRDEVNSGNNFDNRYVQLNTDINLESESTWQPIGSENISFNGIFDGNGHNILNLNIDNSESYQGLFGNNAGTIENLNIKSGTIKGTSKVGAITGKNSGTIINCSNMATVSTTSNATGGICGSNTGNIQKCNNRGIISSDTSIVGVQGGTGGIAGYSESGIIKFCYNNNTINGAKRAGGIAGVLIKGKISSCYNNSNVEALYYTGITGDIFASGIVGYSDSNVDISYCFNNADIISNGAIAAGICARLSGTIRYCYNKANITGLNVQNNTGYAGGIVAYIGDSGEVSYSYNTGSQLIQQGTDKRIGGILGHLHSGQKVLNCYTLSTANPTIIGKISTGGISTNNAAKSDADMKSSSFITLLGGSSYWYLDGGYPKLIWE